mmetsp:Transcript_50830/g.94700  ORF Transcript_50830/g.94700 Transcript_50830/m.94700 type:complete len:443 (-) Transcript_50830:1107-2435(-)
MSAVVEEAFPPGQRFMSRAGSVARTSSHTTFRAPIIERSLLMDNSTGTTVSKHRSSPSTSSIAPPQILSAGARGIPSRRRPGDEDGEVLLSNGRSPTSPARRSLSTVRRGEVIPSEPLFFHASRSDTMARTSCTDDGVDEEVHPGYVGRTCSKRAPESPSRRRLAPLEIKSVELEEWKAGRKGVALLAKWSANSQLPRLERGASAFEIYERTRRVCGQSNLLATFAHSAMREVAEEADEAREGRRRSSIAEILKDVDSRVIPAQMAADRNDKKLPSSFKLLERTIQLMDSNVTDATLPYWQSKRSVSLVLHQNEEEDDIPSPASASASAAMDMDMAASPLAHFPSASGKGSGPSMSDSTCTCWGKLPWSRCSGTPTERVRMYLPLEGATRTLLLLWERAGPFATTPASTSFLLSDLCIVSRLTTSTTCSCSLLHAATVSATW